MNIRAKCNTCMIRNTSIVCVCVCCLRQKISNIMDSSNRSEHGDVPSDTLVRMLQRRMCTSWQPVMKKEQQLGLLCRLEHELWQLIHALGAVYMSRHVFLYALAVQELNSLVHKTSDLARDVGRAKYIMSTEQGERRLNRVSDFDFESSDDQDGRKRKRELPFSEILYGELLRDASDMQRLDEHNSAAPFVDACHVLQSHARQVVHGMQQLKECSQFMTGRNTVEEWIMTRIRQLDEVLANIIQIPLRQPSVTFEQTTTKAEDDEEC